MPLILPANTITGGYEVANSLRFDEASGDYLSKASFGTPTSTRKSTISFWCKRSLIEEGIIFMNDSATFPIAKIYFDSSHRFSYIEFDPSIYIARTTNAVFRDVSAWYHIVIAIDTTQATADDRVKVYINGVQETSFSTSTTPAQNTDLIINNNLRSAIGGSSTAGTDIFEGYISEIIRVDGQQLDATSFGEFDEDSGIWKPIDVSGLTFGTNGFYLDFENSGSLGADVSGNGNNFTVNNLTSIDQTTDTPTNNFCTLNNLYRSRQANDGVFSQGNTKLTYTASDANKGTILSTIGVSSGKWYWEVKVLSASRELIGVGYNDVGSFTGSFIDSSPSKGFSIFAGNGNLYFDATNTSYGTSFSVNDIIMVALDMDNHLCWFGKNGTWFNSATQSEIENSTATNDATTKMGTKQNLNSGEPVFPLFADTSATGQASFEINFGNPPFTISSGNSDANSRGNFEYPVPDGYFSLCTANLAEYG